MKVMSMHKSIIPRLMSALLIASTQLTAASAEEQVVIDVINDDNLSNYAEVAQFGGPSSVGAQMQANDQSKKAAYRFEGFSNAMQPYYEYKAKINEDYGLTLGGDYQALYQLASDSLGKDEAAGGIIRLYGSWTLLGRNSNDKGSIVFKVENRHHLGTEITPSQLADEVGYAGLTAIVFSDAGSLLTNLYWQQALMHNRLAFVAGIVDATDYLNLYGLVNPWTDFSNLAFSTDPTIPVPNQGIGTALRFLMKDHWYLLGGLTDTNGDPSDPGESFRSFFDDREYFVHLEAGWISSYEDRFTDNIHLMIWQADERKAAGIPEGWGAAFSYSQRFNKRWLPFARIAYSDGGGGGFLERSVSTGLGYYPGERDEVLGFGINWGRPSELTFGPGLGDQYTAELYYRFQLFQHVTVTPDIQYLKNPALNTAQSSIWVAGIRARLFF